MNELLLNFACAFAGLGILLHIVQAAVRQGEDSGSVSSRDVFAHVVGAVTLSFASETLGSVPNFGLVSVLTSLASLGLWVHLYYRATGGRVGSMLILSFGTFILYGGVDVVIQGFALALLPWNEGATPVPAASLAACALIGLLGVGLFVRHVRQEAMYRSLAEEPA